MCVLDFSDFLDFPPSLSCGWVLRRCNALTIIRARAASYVMYRRADGAVREVAKNLMFSTQIKGKSDHDAFTDGFPRRCSKTTRSVPIGGLERDPRRLLRPSSPVLG